MIAPIPKMVKTGCANGLLLCRIGRKGCCRKGTANPGSPKPDLGPKRDPEPASISPDGLADLENAPDFFESEKHLQPHSSLCWVSQQSLGRGCVVTGTV